MSWSWRIGRIAGIDVYVHWTFFLLLGWVALAHYLAHGDPANAGRSYSINIAGGILGPLVAAYVLLPTIGTRAALLVLSVPMFLLFAWSRRPALGSVRQGDRILNFQQ